MSPFLSPDHKLLCLKLDGLADEINDSITKLTLLRASAAIRSLSGDLQAATSHKAPDRSMSELARHVSRAGETLYVYGLGSRHMDLDSLHEASRVLRDLHKSTNASQ